MPRQNQEKKLPMSSMEQAEHIKGNASTELKTLSKSLFFHFIDAQGKKKKTFGANIGRRLKFAQINISGFPKENPTLSSSVNAISEKQVLAVAEDEVIVEIVFEMMVERGMFVCASVFFFVSPERNE